MARIVVKVPGNFTGHIGSCRFDQGEGETEVPTLVEFFKRHPDRFDVDSGEDSGEEPAASWADLSDDELVDAFLTNVDPDEFDPENPSREDMIAALEAVDAGEYDAGEPAGEDESDDESEDDEQE